MKIILPESGKTLAIYDDGKVRFSRLNFAKVLEVIPYEKASEELKEELKNKSIHVDWIFNPTTPYFIKCEIQHYNYETKEDYPVIRHFAWSKNEYWFDIFDGFMNDGELDVTGDLSRWLISEIQNMVDGIEEEYSEDIQKLKEIYDID